MARRVKVSSRNQVALPSEARRTLGIRPGDRLAVEVRDGEPILRPGTLRPPERLRGISRGVYGPDPVAHVRALRDEWGQ